MAVFKADSVELINLPRNIHVYVENDSLSPMSIIICKIVVDESAKDICLRNESYDYVDYFRGFS